MNFSATPYGISPVLNYAQARINDELEDESIDDEILDNDEFE